MKKESSKDKDPKKKILRDYLFLVLTIIAMIAILVFFPRKIDPVLSSTKEYLIEMIWILPAIMILIGIFKVWISKDMVVKYLGKTSGLKGIGIALALGTTPTGPLYIAFPLAAAMIQKGARIMNIIIFLSAWACIKVPQEMVELQFLGPEFMATRLVLTIIFVTIMGYVIEKIIERSNLEQKEVR